MSLVHAIKSILDLPREISKETKDEVLRELIENHLAYKNEPLAFHEGKPVLYSPMLERVVNGETTFKQEYKKLRIKFLREPGLFSVFQGNVGLEEDIELLDETIKRLYH